MAWGEIALESSVERHFYACYHSVQLFRLKVTVDLGDCPAGVPQELLDGVQAHPILGEPAGKGVAETVEMEALREPRGPQVLLKPVSDPAR